MQEECQVSRCDGFGGHADDETDCSDTNWTDNMPELLIVSIISIDATPEKLTFSSVLSECQALMTETIQEKTHGGALMRRVGT